MLAGENRQWRKNIQGPTSGSWSGPLSGPTQWRNLLKRKEVCHTSLGCPRLKGMIKKKHIACFNLFNFLLLDGRWDYIKTNIYSSSKLTLESMGILKKNCLWHKKEISYCWKFVRYNFFTGQTCSGLMGSPMLTLSPPRHHYRRAQRCPRLLEKPGTGVSLVTAEPIAKEVTANLLVYWSLLLEHWKAPSNFPIITPIHRCKDPSSLWRAVRRLLSTAPTICATLVLLQHCVALRQTTCMGAFPVLALTSFPPPWMQIRDSGLCLPAPILPQGVVLCAPARRLTLSQVA